MSANNFETYQEFNETSFDLINKMNIITTALNSDGYDNVIVNPQVNNIFLNDKSYTIPDNSPALTRFGFSGWVHSVSGNNTNKCVRLNTIVPSTFSTYNELKNTKLFKLNLKSDMNIYTDANIRIDTNAIYVFAVEYNVVEGSVVDKDLNLNSLKYYNTLTSNFEPISFNSTTDKFTISNIKTVINNKNNFVKYYYIKSNNYFEQNALFRFELSATSTNNTTFIQIYSTNFYKGDILLNGLTNNSINNLVKTVDGVVSVSDNGIDYNPIVNSNVVTVGARGAKYTDLITAINSEADGTIFEIISDITLTTNPTNINKTKNIINGNNFTLTTNSTFNLTGGNNTFNNCDFSFNGSAIGMNINGAENSFKDCTFNFNNISTGLNISTNNCSFKDCTFYGTTNICINLNSSSYNMFVNCTTQNTLLNSIFLSNSKYNILHFKAIRDFYHSNGTSKGIILTNNSDFNDIIIKYSINTGVESLNTPIDSLVNLTNSDTNNITIYDFDLYNTIQPIVKFTNSGHNIVKIDKTVNNVSDLILTDNILPNYIQSYQTQISTNTKLPQQLYSYCTDNKMISENELSLQSLSSGGWFQGDYLRISDNGHNSKQSLKVSNASDKTYICVFGENSPSILTSNIANENMYFVNDSLSTMKSFNVLADTTNITGTNINLFGDTKVIGDNGLTIQYRATPKSQKTTIDNLSDRTRITVIGANANHANDNLYVRGTGYAALKSLDVLADKTTLSGAQFDINTNDLSSGLNRKVDITSPIINLNGTNLNIKADITIIPDQATPQPYDYAFINCDHNLHIKTNANRTILLGENSLTTESKVINFGYTKLGADSYSFKFHDNECGRHSFNANETKTILENSDLDDVKLFYTIDISATALIYTDGSVSSYPTRVAKITDFYIDYATKKVVITYTNPLDVQAEILIFVTTRYAAPF